MSCSEYNYSSAPYSPIRYNKAFLKWDYSLRKELELKPTEKAGKTDAADLIQLKVYFV